MENTEENIIKALNDCRSTRPVKQTPSFFRFLSQNALHYNNAVNGLIAVANVDVVRLNHFIAQDMDLIRKGDITYTVTPAKADHLPHVVGLDVSFKLPNVDIAYEFVEALRDAALDAEVPNVRLHFMAFDILNGEVKDNFRLFRLSPNVFTIKVGLDDAVVTFSGEVVDIMFDTPEKMKVRQKMVETVVRFQGA